MFAKLAVKLLSSLLALQCRELKDKVIGIVVSSVGLPCPPSRGGRAATAVGTSSRGGSNITGSTEQRSTLPSASVKPRATSANPTHSTTSGLVQHGGTGSKVTRPPAGAASRSLSRVQGIGVRSSGRRSAEPPRSSRGTAVDEAGQTSLTGSSG